MKKIILCVGVGGLVAVSTTAATSAIAATSASEVVDGLTLTAGMGLTRDDNLFRAPEGAEDDDEIRDTSLGIKYYKEISLQKFTVDMNVTDYNFRDNSYLDYRGKDLNAAWGWMLTPEFYGNLSWSKVESLNNFMDYVAVVPALRRNIRTTENRRFNGEWEMTPSWHLLGGVSNIDVDNSLPFLEEDNYTADAADLGVKYVSAKGNSIALLKRSTNGTYDRPASAAMLRDSGFDQEDLELQLLWNLTAKTSLNGKLAYIDREHDTFSERDYDGWTGNVSLNWAPTAKLAFVLGARRVLNSYQETASTTQSFSSYYEGDYYYFGPIWQATDKIRLSAQYGVEDRNYLGTIVGGIPLRDDEYKQAQLSLEWQATRNVGFNLGYYDSRRDSNDDGFDFTSRMYVLSVLLQI